MNFILNICFVLLPYFIVLDAVKFRCDYAFVGHGWYKYYEIPATFVDARLRCKLQGAILASPTTDEIKSLMIRSMKQTAMFTGFHATNTHGEYYSLDGIPFDTIPHQWANYEPNNKDNVERCLALNSEGKYGDVRCDKVRPYLCYREFSKNNNESNICGTPDTEYYFESRTNKCYKFHTTPRIFERAEFACAAEGGHLVIMNSAEESIVIQELFARYPYTTMIGNFLKDFAYIGFYDWETSRDWITIHGQTLNEAGFNTFSADEPNNATTGEYCGAVYRNGQLGDILCMGINPFICEKKPDFPPVCDSESFLKPKRNDTLNTV